ncbi:hypothetical protein L3D22_08205 [Lysobacter soli]|uniref:hypothetical protein n=1 Tax=Lysobacter soli TaxID=453783 RepID=UPI00209DB2D6|nr:hypothetical protein [Lysobacter soli]UTA55762.1 hypothetical protein L3D22_08205 [Lysobacter soli]
MRSSSRVLDELRHSLEQGGERQAQHDAQHDADVRELRIAGGDGRFHGAFEGL